MGVPSCPKYVFVATHRAIPEKARNRRVDGPLVTSKPCRALAPLEASHITSPIRTATLGATEFQSSSWLHAEGMHFVQVVAVRDCFSNM